MSGEEGSVLRSLFSVQRAERRAVGLAVAAFFCLLFAIFLLRPLRDAMGLQGGARNLKYLWSLTLVGTMVASLAFAHVTSKLPRRSFMAWTYRGVAFLWLALLPAVALAEGELGVFFARAFYVLHAVSNVFIVSIFWGLLADVFDSGQSRRLFGLVAVGGTLGAIAGTKLIEVLSELGADEHGERVLAFSLARTAYFARTESWAQTLTLVVQLFVTGHLMRWLGVGGALLVLPLVALAGCAALLWHEPMGLSALAIVTVTLVAWRGLSHSAMRPAREALFVPTSRAEKYKAKSFTDTFAFRGGDLASAYLQGVSSMASIAVFGLGLAVAWGGLGSVLARVQRRWVAKSG